MFSVELDSRTIARRVVSYAMTLTAAMLVIAAIVIPRSSPDSHTTYLSYFVLLLVYLPTAFFLLHQNRYYKSSTVSIVLDTDSNVLHLPRLIFPKKPRQVILEDITSLEALNTGKEVALAVGIHNKHTIIIDPTLCSNSEDLAELRRRLEAHLQKSPSRFFERKSQALSENYAQLSKREFFIAALSVVLLGIYYFTTEGFSNEIILARFVENGANTNRIWDDQEFYRIFSSFFLHYNFMHLISNIALFAVFGSLMIRILGVIRFFNVVLFTSVMAVLVSNYFIGGNASFGASGGGFGLLGAYTIIKLKYSHRLSPLLNPMPNWILAVVLLMELFSGLYYDAIDLNNHLGGFFAGAAYVQFIHIDEGTSTDKSTIWETIFFGVLLGLYAWGLFQFLDLSFI